MSLLRSLDGELRPHMNFQQDECSLEKDEKDK